MNVGPAFIADPQPAIATEPGEGSLHHPAMAAQGLRGLDPSPGDSRGDAPAAAGLAAMPRLVRFIGMALPGPAARATAARRLDRYHRIEGGLQPLYVVPIGPR